MEGNVKGRMEVTRTQGRRLNYLLNDLKNRKVYCKLKEEALVHTIWRTGFGRGY